MRSGPRLLRLRAVAGDWGAGSAAGTGVVDIAPVFRRFGAPAKAAKARSPQTCADAPTDTPQRRDSVMLHCKNAAAKPHGYEGLSSTHGRRPPPQQRTVMLYDAYELQRTFLGGAAAAAS